MTHLLLEGPDGRTYIARKAELSNVPWAYDRESWLVTEFGVSADLCELPSDWWFEQSGMQWVSQTYDSLGKFAILAIHTEDFANP
jgi:hypothetical protein